jgi:hypothetical protein
MIMEWDQYISVGSVVLGIALLTSSASGIVVTGNDSGIDLANTMLGSGISIFNVNYVGVSGQAGKFTDGLSAGIGIDSGILLTSGKAELVTDENTRDNMARDNGTAGDATLDALSGKSTLDANILEFDFTFNDVGSGSKDVYFNYVFGSDEYNEYVNSRFNDVFAFFLDGKNIALIPGSSEAVNIDNVNLGKNSALYNNNDLSDFGSAPYAFEYDGFTDVFQAQALGLDSTETHHIKLAIADSGDHDLDSGVFIQGGTFSDRPTPTPDGGSSMLLIGCALSVMSVLRKRFGT